MSDPVSINSTFEQILGKTCDQFTEAQRMQRWKEWQKIAEDSGSHETAAYWRDTEACEGCIHLGKENAWCAAVGLPCTVNPYLTFKTGLIGMACMGAGKEEAGQMVLV